MSLIGGAVEERAPVSPRELPCEVTELHTRILRCMLATEDSNAYWRNVDLSVPAAERSRVAFERRWFGVKSEARVRTLVGDMADRFDAYPEALALLHSIPSVSANLRPLICHLHTQLADPLYRRFSGEWLPARRDRGHTSVDRPEVMRWISSVAPGRWSDATVLKFASNLLATVHEAGLVAERRDPRRIPTPHAPVLAVGYALYLLRTIAVEGSLTDNPYLRSLGVTSGTFRSLAPHVPGIRYVELGGIGEVEFTEPNLLAWGSRFLAEVPS